MGAKRGSYRGRQFWRVGMGLILVVTTGTCTSPAPLGLDGEARTARGRPGQADGIRFVGTVDLVWPGGKGMNAPDEERTAQASIAAFPDVAAGDPGPGTFAYRVLAMDGSLHREIGVKLFWVHVDVDADTVRFLGEVISDTKTCGGPGHGDDGGEHDSGGCSHDDGGCSHEDDASHDDGGCSHEHDDGTDDHAEAGGPGGPGESGGHVSGADCRLGQVVIGWAQDGGTPAAGNDRISWKWFAADAPKVLEIEAAISAGEEISWPCKLCEKEIIGGNLLVQGD